MLLYGGYEPIIVSITLFPLLLRGAPPIPTGLGIVATLTAVITLLVGGLNRRGARDTVLDNETLFQLNG